MDFEIRDFIRVERLTENKQYVIHNYKIEYSVPTTETYIYKFYTHVIVYSTLNECKKKNRDTNYCV